MKVYKVIRGNSFTDNAEEIFFTSRDKAFGYIIGRYAESNAKPLATVRHTGVMKKFCYNTDMLFNVKNCTEYDYIIKGEYYYINVINVL